MLAVTGKLHDLVVGPVGPDVADDGQDQVSGIDALPELSVQVEADGLGDHDPGFARDHGIEEIRAAYTGSESAQGSVGGGMGIRAEDQLAGAYIVFHHDLVADALALIELYIVLPGKVPHLPVGCRRLCGIGRHVVVHDKDHLFGIRDPGML